VSNFLSILTVFRAS